MSDLNNKSHSSECLLGPCGLYAWSSSDHSGRYWEHQDQAPSCAEENCRGAWIAMWVLHSRNCHVHVHTPKEPTKTINERHGNSIPRRVFFYLVSQI